jgi:hypothetical protein
MLWPPILLLLVSSVQLCSGIVSNEWLDVTGDVSKSTKAIVDVYDIFGLANQTLQGADAVRILSQFTIFTTQAVAAELMR